MKPIWILGIAVAGIAVCAAFKPPAERQCSPCKVMSGLLVPETPKPVKPVKKKEPLPARNR